MTSLIKIRPAMVSVSTVMSDEIVQAAERAVREDWERNGGVYYFNQHTFQQCWAKIWKLIKIQPVKDILMKYHLIEDPDDFYVISSPYLSPKQHADNLLSQIIPKAGDYGHYLLYMAIRDSRPSNPLGHTQAIEELKKHAMGQQPPWTRETYPIQETEGTWECTNSGMQSFSGMERREVVVGHTPQQVVGGTLLGEDMERDSAQSARDGSQQQERPPPPSYESIFGGTHN